jgi:hypothetical protein
MPNPPRSISREIGANKIRGFSSFDDYLKVLIDDGTVKSSHDLVSRRPGLLGEILFQWYRQREPPQKPRNLLDRIRGFWAALCFYCRNLPEILPQFVSV